MSTVMKLSVILTSYNRDRLLRDAALSVLNQTCPKDFELLIMDDDSENPETHKVLDELDDDPRTAIHRMKLNGVPRFSRTGYAQNINLALQIACGELIMYLTCDDIFLPGALESCAAHFDAHPEHLVAYGVQKLARLHPDFSTTPLGLRDEGPVVMNGANRLDHNQMMHRACMVKMFPPRLWPENPEVIGCADAGVWLALTGRGIPVHRVNAPPTCEHRFHKNSIQAL